MLRLNKISPKKPCPFCGAFLENEAPSTIWCHPQNSCLLSLRGITGDDQIAQWDTRFDAKGMLSGRYRTERCHRASRTVHRHPCTVFRQMILDLCVKKGEGK